MPLMGEFHQNYWVTSDTFVAPIVPPGRGGYPLWQASVVSVGPFGTLSAWISTWWVWLKWHWALAKRLHALPDESRAVVLQAVTMLEHPAYPLAQAAVRRTAVTLGFNRPEAWRELSRAVKDDPGRAENVYRHLNAMQLVRTSVKTSASSSLTNPQQNLIIELAYTGFSVPTSSRI